MFNHVSETGSRYPWWYVLSQHCYRDDFSTKLFSRRLGAMYQEIYISHLFLSRQKTFVIRRFKVLPMAGQQMWWGRVVQPRYFGWIPGKHLLIRRFITTPSTWTWSQTKRPWCLFLWTHHGTWWVTSWQEILASFPFKCFELCTSKEFSHVTNRLRE